jgi:hypothetical protein
MRMKTPCRGQARFVLCHYGKHSNYPSGLTRRPTHVSEYWRVGGTPFAPHSFLNPKPTGESNFPLPHPPYTTTRGGGAAGGGREAMVIPSPVGLENTALPIHPPPLRHHGWAAKMSPVSQDSMREVGKNKLWQSTKRQIEDIRSMWTSRAAKATKVGWQKPCI